jgi:hypothetical protein
MLLHQEAGMHVIGKNPPPDELLEVIRSLRRTVNSAR